jgi:hypothetical protein
MGLPYKCLVVALGRYSKENKITKKKKKIGYALCEFYFENIVFFGFDRMSISFDQRCNSVRVLFLCYKGKSLRI